VTLPTIAQIDRATAPADVAKAFRAPATERAEDQWWTWPNVLEGFQAATRSRLDHLPAFPEPREERGIVIVGGAQYLASVYVTVRVLRHVGCDLPIEVWHFRGEDEPRLADAIREYDVTFVDADGVGNGVQPRFLQWHWWKGWQLKSVALCHTRFRQVLLLDADCYPVRSPAYLFDWPEFERCGAVFWPDLQESPTVLNDSVLSLFELPRPTDRLTESGQLLIDREKSWQPLNLAAFYNECADLVYRYIWGDKDTFPFAWSRCGREYARMWPECDYRSDCLLQFDFNGHVVFQHRVSDKFKLNGSRFASTCQDRAANIYHGGLAHESFCFHAINELRARLGTDFALLQADGSRTHHPPTGKCDPSPAPTTTKLPRSGSIEDMYPRVTAEMLCSGEWQERFREYFLETGELAVDPFTFSRLTDRPHRRCVSVSLFKQNIDNRYPHEFPVSHDVWWRKYWDGLRQLVEDMYLLPDWKLRVYVEPELIADALREYSAHPQVELYGMESSSVGANPGSLWRFIALADASLELTLVTDVDEPLSPKLDCIRSFELDENSTIGRFGGFVSNHDYLVAPQNSEVKNYATIIGSRVMSRPRRIDFDVVAAMRGFMAYRRDRTLAANPWSYTDEERPSAYNQPIGGHAYGWGSHWYMYCFDERFLKHVVYYHFADQGGLHTWTPSLPPSQLSDEGAKDLDYVRNRGNPSVAPEFVSPLRRLNLSPSALRVALTIEEHRWIFERIRELMCEYSQTGFCGNVFFDDINDPYGLAHVPKRIRLFESARHASKGLEVGFNAGHSSALMLLANPRLTIRAFDNCAHAYTRPCLEFLNDTFDNRVEIVEGPSQLTVPQDCQSGYDLLHIDGDHSYSAVRADLTCSLQKAAHNAIVIMDDCSPGSSVERAVLERNDLVQTSTHLMQTDSLTSSQRVYRYLADRQ